jgi:hypothetical protein
MSDALFPSDQTGARERRASGFDDTIIAAYVRAARTLDDLPYTAELESIVSDARKIDPAATQHAVFRRLHNIRKAGSLPKIGRAATSPARITPEDESRLAALVQEAVGTLGQRDQLPCTPHFDAIVERFNAETGRSLDPHDVWRLIAKIAK